MAPVAMPATMSCRRSAMRRLRRVVASGLAELGQRLHDDLLSVLHFGEEADAIDVAVGIPGRFHQDAGFLLRRDGEAVHGLGEQLAIELADLLGRVLD